MQTTTQDWVISGHGSTHTDSKPLHTVVPSHIRLHLLAPPGAALSMRLGQALERGEYIGGLTLVQNGRRNSHNARIYLPGQQAPNLTLHVIDAHDIGTPTVPHVIGVVMDTSLDALWARIPNTGKVVDVYWAACGNIDGDGHGPMVDIAD